MSTMITPEELRELPPLAFATLHTNVKTEAEKRLQELQDLLGASVSASSNEPSGPRRGPKPKRPAGGPDASPDNGEKPFPPTKKAQVAQMLADGRPGQNGAGDADDEDDADDDLLQEDNSP